MSPLERIELLELAVKATGADHEISDGVIEITSEIGGYSGIWNPLEDDGDALRLAVKLEINVLPTMEECSARNPSFTGWINEDGSRDPFAATRRAIVRAAAEIGRAAV